VRRVRDPGRRRGDGLTEKAREWERRRRALHGLSLLVNGLAVCLSAGIIAAFLAQILPLPVHPGIITAGLVAVCAAVCGVLGALRRSGARRSLLAADRRLALKERLSSAYELMGSEEENPFAELLIADAVSHARDIRARDVYPFRPPRKWKFLPPLIALLAVVLLVDFGLPDLTARPGAAVVEQGQKLEDLGRRLAARARRDFLPETLRLAEEIERLANDLQRSELDRDEAADRLSNLADQAGDQSREMQQQLGRNGADGGSSSGSRRSAPLAGAPGAGSEAGEGEADQTYGPTDQPGGSPGGQSPPGQGPPAEQSGRSSGDTRSPDGSRRDIEGLEEAEEALRDSVQELAAAEPQNDSSGEETEQPESPDEAPMMLAEGEKPQSDGSDGPAPGEPGRRGGEPGTEAARDETQEPDGYSGDSEEPITELDAPPSDGDALEGLIRALPPEARPDRPLEDFRQEYGAQLEETIAREEVPLNFKRYIRDYFIVIGILEEGSG